MRFLVLSFLITLSACSSTSKTEAPAPQPVDYFAGKKGCFLLYNMKTEKFDKVIGEENCRERFVACSTFKVPLAVMAFDSGALKDENVVLKWDGKKDAREVANRDHDAKSWMRDSIVWYSQRLTPKIGEKKLKKYLKPFNYGNQDLAGGLKQAWLVAPSEPTPALKISAYEQVEFMKNLWTDKLPASKRAMQLARDITYVGVSPKGTELHGKTGSNFYNGDTKMRLGWFISHAKLNDQEYIAVTQFSDVAPTAEESFGGLKAREITQNILSEMGLW